MPFEGSLKSWTIDVDGMLINPDNNVTLDFSVPDGAVVGASVFNSYNAKVGIVIAVDDEGVVNIIPTGVEDHFSLPISFGSEPFRIDSFELVELADGTLFGDGEFFQVIDCAVLDVDDYQVGLRVPCDTNDEFFIISKGGLAFPFSIADDRTVSDRNGERLVGWTVRESDGAVLDCDGDIRAFADVSTNARSSLRRPLYEAVNFW